jgi:hypothetical protein
MMSVIAGLLPLGIVALVVFLIVSGFMKGLHGVKGTHICPQCGTRAEPRTETRGSIWIEVVLWLCLIVPGLIYSIWRLTSRYQACPACHHAGMIPIDSPIGRQLAERFPR